MIRPLIVCGSKDSLDDDGDDVDSGDDVDDDGD